MEFEEPEAELCSDDSSSMPSATLQKLSRQTDGLLGLSNCTAPIRACFFEVQRHVVACPAIISAVFVTARFVSHFHRHPSELCRSSRCDLMEVRLCFLEWNHIFRAHRAVRYVASL